MLKDEELWYVECKICANFNQSFEVCKLTCVKPAQDKNSMCKLYANLAEMD